jgi:hypothetical protein
MEVLTEKEKDYWSSPRPMVEPYPQRLRVSRPRSLIQREPYGIAQWLSRAGRPGFTRVP